MDSGDRKCHFQCNVIITDYIVNVIIISYYFHDYTRCLIIYHAISCQRCGLVELIYPMTCAFMANILLTPLILLWILISEILKQFNVGQWHHSLLYSFISRTYQKTHLVLTKQHVNTVMCLCLYYTCNRVNIDEESHSCLCYIHCNHDYLTV